MATSKSNLEKQPQSREAEEAVLGSMLISKEAVSKTLQWLPSADYFYIDNHVKIFSCMLNLFENGEPIGNIFVKSSNLKAINCPKDLSPLSIDEYPLLFILASLTKVISFKLL